MSRRHRVAQVVVGILSSRVSGLVRTRVLAHFFGVSALGDVWTAALRGPNVVQNLLGEQALSAAFIPIYVRKLAGGDEREASRFAGAILSLLLVTLSLVALLGVLLARPIVAVLLPAMIGGEPWFRTLRRSSSEARRSIATSWPFERCGLFFR